MNSKFIHNISHNLAFFLQMFSLFYISDFFNSILSLDLTILSSFFWILSLRTKGLSFFPLNFEFMSYILAFKFANISVQILPFYPKFWTFQLFLLDFEFFILQFCNFPQAFECLQFFWINLKACEMIHSINVTVKVESCFWDGIKLNKK